MTMGRVPVFGRKKPQPQPPEELIGKLFLIGSLKNAMPLNLRGWVNEVGLYVQLAWAGPSGRLQAGDDKWKANISVWFRRSGERWDIEKINKYSTGSWENLVDPTLELAAWISVHGGLYGDMHDRLAGAVQRFRSSGTWALLTKEESSQLGAWLASVMEETAGGL